MNALVVSPRHRMLARGLTSPRLLGRRMVHAASLVVPAGIAVIASVLVAPRDARAQAAAPAAGAFTIADGGLSLEAPQAWKQVPPKSRIVDAEFQIPGTGPDDAGRMTVMGAGGTVEMNIDRWYGQFTQPDGSATKDHATTKALKIAGCQVTIVDVAGTRNVAPHSGQYAFLPAKRSFTRTSCPFGQRASIPMPAILLVRVADVASTGGKAGPRLVATPRPS